MAEATDNTDFGVVVVFYDRRNRREVRADRLMATRVVRHVLVCDDDDQIPTGRRYDPLTREPLTRAQVQQAVTRGDSDWPEMRLAEWDSWKHETTPVSPQAAEQVIGEFAYKSENCPSYKNWDLYLMESDLVFLRCEARDPKVERWRRAEESAPVREFAESKT